MAWWWPAQLAEMPGAKSLFSSPSTPTPSSPFSTQTTCSLCMALCPEGTKGDSWGPEPAQYLAAHCRSCSNLLPQEPWSPHLCSSQVESARSVAGVLLGCKLQHLVSASKDAEFLPEWGLVDYVTGGVLG